MNRRIKVLDKPDNGTDIRGLLYGNAFREVTGLIDVETSCAGNVVAKKLERNDSKGCCEELVDLGNVNDKVC